MVLDNLAGHKTPDFVLWLVAQGLMPLYTPLSGSWINMAESIQRVWACRALACHYPETPAQIMLALEAAAAHWNQAPTPFVWGGKRATHRTQAPQHRHALGAPAPIPAVPSSVVRPNCINGYIHPK